MIIDKDISPYIINEQENVRAALVRIELNKQGHIFAVKDDGALEGVLTDGDIRRWLVDEKIIDLSRPITDIINKDFIFAHIDQDIKKIEKQFSNKIHFIPLLDEYGRLAAIARRRGRTISIQGRTIGEAEPAFIIAEIGNNHNGSVVEAKRLVDLAKESGADCVKFQMRDLESLYANNGLAGDAKEDLGSQYTLDLLNKFNLSPEQMFEVFDYCKEKQILFLCTPWDLKSLECLEKYGMPAYKIASADLVNHELLLAAIRTGKPLICSTGMSSEKEIRLAVELLRQHGAQFALLHCNSTYPAPFKDINLYYLEALKEIGDCLVGYSGHERGINIALAAVALGSRIIEKHFTSSRNLEGNDHKVSLLPEEFKIMVEGIREVEAALGQGKKTLLSQGEVINREVLGKSLAVNCDVKTGELIKASMLSVRGPGKGIPPYRKDEVLGKSVRRDLKKGDLIYPTDIDESKAMAKRYNFRRPWGIPVRYHDFAKVDDISNVDLYEFHLSYRDLDEDISRYFNKKFNKKLIVHAPELFAGDHLLDLASLDENYRRQSVTNLQRVIDVATKIKEYFVSQHRPMVVVHVGGARLEKMISVEEKEKLYDTLAKSLEELNYSKNEIEILPETMPPLPWHFGGQRYHNLLVDPDEIIDFSRRHGFRICFDVGHSKLACNYYHWSFRDFLEKVAPLAAHYHISDASGVDSEGLQIQEGEIDFKLLAEMMDRYSPDAFFIPEIWQGHKDDYAGLWLALNKLEKWL